MQAFSVFSLRKGGGGREGEIGEGRRKGGREGGRVAYLAVENLRDLAPIPHPVGFQCCVCVVSKWKNNEYRSP
jgi:hypothetical protein